jgi:CDP-6-deoxy-D-xylo-4-hexulose-3-dehydrase
MKMTEMQAAIGVAQMKKLDKFGLQRSWNWRELWKRLSKFEDLFYIPKPTHNALPSWFSFLLTIKDKRISRNALQRYLESKEIQTRLLFAGNITKQPCFSSLVEWQDYKIIGDLANTNKVMNDGIMVGVYPGLKTAHMNYIADKIEEFVNDRTLYN